MPFEEIRKELFNEFRERISGEERNLKSKFIF